MNAINTKTFSMKKDFLSCHEKKQVVEDLKKQGERKYSGECLSDYVFLFDKKLKKKRVCILITEKNVYVYETKKWRLIFMNELAAIKAVSIASKNCTLLSMHFMSGGDLMMESYRRIDIILYCAKCLKDARLGLFKLKIRKNFKSTMTKNGEQDDAPLKDVPIKDIEKSKKNIDNSFLQETIRNSKKSGYLKLFKKNFIGLVSFTEYFYVLSDLGLVSFKKYGDKKAHSFLPILGGTMKIYPKTQFNKDFIFGIRFADEESILQASSKVEMDDWTKLIKELQDKCLTSKDTMKEISKVL